MKSKTTINTHTVTTTKSYIPSKIPLRSWSTTVIRSITSADLKSYTQEMVNTIRPTRKSFTAYKGILNLVFNYAREYEIVLSNPVSTIKNIFYYPSCTATSSKSEEKILSEAEIQTVKDTVRSYISPDQRDGRKFSLTNAIKDILLDDLCAIFNGEKEGLTQIWWISKTKKLENR